MPTTVDHQGRHRPDQKGDLVVVGSCFYVTYDHLRHYFSPKLVVLVVVVVGSCVLVVFWSCLVAFGRIFFPFEPRFYGFQTTFPDFFFKILLKISPEGQKRLWATFLETLGINQCIHRIIEVFGRCFIVFTLFYVKKQFFQVDSEVTAYQNLILLLIMSCNPGRKFKIIFSIFFTFDIFRKAKN